VHQQHTAASPTAAAHTRAAIPWPHVRFVRALRGLGAPAKLVFDELRGLSRGRGATIGAAALAARLGLSRDAVERARRELAQWGLVRSLDLGPGRRAAWFPSVPPEYWPKGLRPSDDEVQRLADAYSARYAQLRAQGGADMPPLTDTGAEPPAPRVPLIRTQVAANLRHSGADTPPPAHTKTLRSLRLHNDELLREVSEVSEVSEESEERDKARYPGERDSAPDAQKDGAALEPPTWLTEQPPPVQPPEGDEPEEADDEPA